MNDDLLEMAKTAFDLAVASKDPASALKAIETILKIRDRGKPVKQGGAPSGPDDAVSRAMEARNGKPKPNCSSTDSAASSQ